MEESWRPLPNQPGVPRLLDYEVSNRGRVRRTTPGRRGAGYILKPTLLRTGRNQCYLRVNLAGNRNFTLARLVAWAWLPPPPSPVARVRYRDGNVLNCTCENLVWDYGTKPAVKLGRASRRRTGGKAG